jgi:hypothetical protein
MELLMQRSRVHESIQMTMQRFLHGLRLPIKNIVRHHAYNDNNQLLHHAMEAEAQIAEEAQQKSRFHLLVDTLPGRLPALPHRHLRGLLVAPPCPLGQRPLELSPGVLLPQQPLVLVRVPP